jgi:hypothetical protein
VAQHIDLIVHLTADVDEATGKRRRVVAEVIEVDTGEGHRPAVTDLFAPGPDGLAVPVGRPTFLEELVRQGFDAALLDAGHDAWARQASGRMDLPRDGRLEVGR